MDGCIDELTGALVRGCMGLSSIVTRVGCWIHT